MGYRLDDQGSIPNRGGDFLLLHSNHTGSGTHSASYPVGTGALFPRVRWLGREADSSLLSSAEVKNGGAYLQSLIRLHGVVLS
jgi:hypothetical protein